MFHLNAGIHFDEVEAAVLVHEEFDGAGIGVADGGESPSSASPRSCFAQFGVTAGGGRLFDQFLVAALDGAFALAEDFDVAVWSASNWNSIWRGLRRTSPVQVGAGESSRRPRLGLRQQGGQFFGRCVDHAHAAPAAAGAGLEDDRVADLGGDLERLVNGRLNNAFGSGQNRDAAFFMAVRACCLRPIMRVSHRRWDR
jgi:hypothetical protein